MAKEPALLAEIRANRARVEKAAKVERSAAPPPQGAPMTGTVITPETPQRPNNYIVAALDECTTVAHCDELLAHARQHGFSESGLTAQLIHARRKELSGPAVDAGRRRGRASKRGAR